MSGKPKSIWKPFYIIKQQRPVDDWIVHSEFTVDNDKQAEAVFNAFEEYNRPKDGERWECIQYGLYRVEQLCNCATHWTGTPRSNESIDVEV